MLSITEVLRAAPASQIDPELEHQLRSEAALIWAEAFNEFLLRPSARRLIETVDGRSRTLYWENHPEFGARLIRGDYFLSSFIVAANQRYAFEIGRPPGGDSPYALEGLWSEMPALKSVQELQFLPADAVCFGYPLYLLADPALFRIQRIERIPGTSPSGVEIEAESIADVTFKQSEPRGFFERGLCKGVKMTVIVDPLHRWRLLNARFAFPRRFELVQIVEYPSEDIYRVQYEEYDVTPRGAILNPESVKVMQVEKLPVPDYEPAQFTLGHYGLSEKSADFLRRSRSYILTFLALFSAWMICQFLAWRAAGKRDASTPAGVRQ